MKFLGLVVAVLMLTPGSTSAAGQDCAGPDETSCFLESALIHARVASLDARISTLIEIAALHAAAGDLEGARHLFGEALAGLPEGGEPVSRFTTLRHLARRQAESGFKEEATTRLREAAAIARKALEDSKDPAWLGWGRSLQSVALSLARQDDRHSAMAALQTIIATIAEIDDVGRRYTEYVVLAGPAAKHGLTEAATAAFAAAWTEGERMTDARERLFSLLAVAEEQWKAGLLPEARRNLEIVKSRAFTEDGITDREGLLALVNLRLYQVAAGVRFD
ncbi:tetratricopeptide repeat protein [Shumkonia mesophila]|uniref:tetratricopeptide repeat protein n=1 Tax=Shumkonia mesophila TaxID=2838854 RepID=UPI00293523FB|nr:tetratricopeptide repeat protein [Shumkonia mesophila]